MKNKFNLKIIKLSDMLNVGNSTKNSVAHLSYKNYIYFYDHKKRITRYVNYNKFGINLKFY